MKKMIVLNKDKSTEIIKEKNFKYNKNMEYILIPLDSYNLKDVFLGIKANKYMNFDYVKMDIEMANAVNDTDDYDNEHQYSSLMPFHNLNIKTSSIIELYNYIQSLNRLDYFNDLINSNLENPIQRVIDILSFKISIYKNDNCIFSYEYNKFEDENDKSKNAELCYSLGVLDYGFQVIYKGINKIYETITDNLFINKKTNKWSFKDKNYNNCICGVLLMHTHTIYFVNPTEYVEFCKMKDQTIIMHIEMLCTDEPINLKELTCIDDVDNYLAEGYVEYYESLEIYHNRKTILEFLVYAHFLYNSIELAYSLDIGIEDFNPIISFYTGKHDTFVIFDKHTIPDYSEFEYFLERMRGT